MWKKVTYFGVIELILTNCCGFNIVYGALLFLKVVATVACHELGINH